MPVACASVAEMVARQIGHTLDQKFGTRWNKDAGAYLRSQFYSRGAEQTLDGIMRSGTGEPVTTHSLVDYFHATSPLEAEASPARGPRDDGRQR